MPTLKGFGFSKIVAYVLDEADALGAAITGTSAGPITVATGDGAHYAGASTALPHKIRVDDEILYVTDRSADTLTVTRGKDGTTAATHLNAAVVDHKFPLRLVKANNYTENFNISADEFPGDGTIEKVFRSDGLDGTFQLSKLTTEMLDRIAGAAGGSTGLYSDEATRWLPELGDYPDVELHVDRKIQNEALSNAEGIFRTVIPLCSLQKPTSFGDISNRGAQLVTFNWAARSTLVDIWGEPIADGAGAAITEEVTHWLALLS